MSKTMFEHQRELDGITNKMERIAEVVDRQKDRINDKVSHGV